MSIGHIQNKTPIIFAIALLITSFYSLLNAESEVEEEARNHRLDCYSRYMPSRSVEAMPGRIEILESGAEYSYEFKAFGKLPLVFSLNHEYIQITDDKSLAVDLPAHLIGLGTDMETTLPFFGFRETYLRLGISPSFYSDDFDFETSNFRIPMRYFLIHRPNEKLTLIGGIAIYPDFEDEIWPILGLIYRPNDKLTFNLVPKRPKISYLLNEKITLFAEGGISSQEFEVTRENAKNVVLRYKQARLGSGIKYEFNSGFQVSFSAGGIFSRSLKYRDNQGKVNLKDGLYSELRLEIEL